MQSLVSDIQHDIRRKKHGNQKSKYIRISIVVGLIVLCIWLIGFAVQKYYCIKSEGVFTTLSTLFSALAFAGVIVTIFMQREELELQRDEMEAQRIEMEGQKEEFIKQNVTLSRQRYETTFFQLMQRQAEIRASIVLKIDGTTEKKGVDSFKHIYVTFDRTIFNAKARARKDYEEKRTPEQEEIFEASVRGTLFDYLTTLKAFKDLLLPYENDLLHYYNHLLVTILFVKNTYADVKVQRYYDFIKSELSQYELLCLFYYGLTDYGKEFKPLLDSIDILSGVDKNKVIDKEHFFKYEVFKDKAAYIL